MTSDLFLSTKDLCDLTGYKAGYYQAAWLKSHGYPYELTISGKPRVLREFVEKKLGLANVNESPQTKPDFSHWTQPKAA